MHHQYFPIIDNQTSARGLSWLYHSIRHKQPQVLISIKMGTENISPGVPLFPIKQDPIPGYYSKGPEWLFLTALFLAPLISPRPHHPFRPETIAIHRKPVWHTRPNGTFRIERSNSHSYALIPGTASGCWRLGVLPPYFRSTQNYSS